MRMTRRRLVLGLVALGVAGTGGITAAATSGWRESVIARLVRRHVPGARVSEADMTLFAREYLTRQGVSDGLLAARALLAPLRREARWMLPPAVAMPLRKLDDQAVRNFLLATDYFEPGRPVDRVTFVAYPDPYGSGCANPLARFDEA